MFEWMLVRWSNLIYHIQKTMLLSLFSFSQSVPAVNRTLIPSHLYFATHIL